MLDNTMIFSLTANRELALEISQHLGIPLSEANVTHFADGEIMAKPMLSVRGKSIYIIQSTCNPVTERLMEILIFVDACKRASAKEINVVIPYFGYARQDRKANPREPITSKLVAELLQVAGVDRVLVVDLHAPQIQGFFDCPVDDLSAIPMFTAHLRKVCAGQEIVVVSPDHGGTTRARRLATGLDAPMAIIDKRRPRPNVAEVQNVMGDVEGKIAILVDDIIDTGGSIAAAAAAVLSRGAKEVHVVCTHLVLSKDASTKLQNSVIKSIIATNTIPVPADKMVPKFQIVSVGAMLAKAIDHIEKGLPLSEVYGLYRNIEH